MLDSSLKGSTVSGYLEDLVDAITSRTPGWRERFEAFYASNEPEETKAFIGALAGTTMLDDTNDPADYPFAASLIQGILAYDLPENGDLPYVASLIRLFILMGSKEEAGKFMNKLRKQTESIDPIRREAARQYITVLEGQFPMI